MEMSLKVSQPPPHGGRLVNAVVDREEGGAKMAAGCPAYDIRPTIDRARESRSGTRTGR